MTFTRNFPEQPVQSGRCSNFCFSIIPKYHDPCFFKFPCYETQHQERRMVGFLKIIENNDKRFRTRSALEQSRGGIKESKPRLVRVG